jgi:dihydroorotase (multifunctional complex type)
MPYQLGIENGTIVTGRGRYQGNIYVEDGRIAGITSGERFPADRTINADGLFILPGMIDGHCHFQDPGDSTREDFPHGSSAAAIGGVTTLIEHTHSDPVTTPAFLDEKVRYLEKRSVVDFGLAAHVWPTNYDTVADLWRAGVTFFKIFTCTTHGVPALLPGPMLRVFRNLAAVDALCLVHCEDETITDDNEALLRAAGRNDFGIILDWRTREAEQVAANTVTLLARMTGVRAIIAHISHPPVVRLIERERAAGARLWAEACPQYFYLREEEVLTEGPFRKFTPPCRSAAEGEALWPLLQSGALTHISTDHAPSTREQKEAGRQDIWECHFGLPGVQTTLTMMLNAVSEGKLTLERLVDAYAEAPARLYRLAPRKGRIEPGADADLVLVDLSRTHTISDEEMVSKAGWTPYAGRTVKGAPVMTVSRGAVVAANGKVEADPGHGRYIPGPGSRL